MSQQTIVSSNIMDQALNLNLMQNLLKGSKGNSCFWTTISNYILLIGQDQFKSLFKAIVDKVSAEIQKANFTTLVGLYDVASSLVSKLFFFLKPLFWVVNRIKCLFKDDTPMIGQYHTMSIDVSPYDKCLYFPMEFKQCFWESILKPKYSNFIKFRQEVVSLSQKDKTSIITEEKFSNIVITTDDFEAKLMSPIKFEFINNGSKTIHSLAKLKVEYNLFDDGDYYEFLEESGRTASLKENELDYISLNLYVLIPNVHISAALKSTFYDWKDLCDLLNNGKFPIFIETYFYAFSNCISPPRLYFTSDRTDVNARRLINDLNHVNITPQKQSIIINKEIMKLYNIDVKIPTLEKILPLIKDYVYRISFNDERFKIYFIFCVFVMLMFNESRVLIKKTYDEIKKTRKYPKYFEIKDYCVKPIEGGETSPRDSFCNVFNIPIDVNDHTAFICKIYCCCPYFENSESKDILEPFVERIENFFNKTVPQPFRSDNGLKFFINYLFKSCSFLEVPFPNIELGSSSSGSKSSSSDSSANKEQSVDICLTSKNNNDNVELQNKFIKFCQNICEQIVSDNEPDKNIDVYTISIDRQEVKSEKPNPDFEIWKQKIDLLKELTESKDPAAIKQYGEMCALQPTSVIESVSINKIIKRTKINSVQKSLSTMYLSKKDKTTLTSLLHTFRNNIKKFEKLGLPKKLGVLLHGLPGCGKTSTVIAIATYLQKDIYYLNLNGVKTNEELSMLFDYVVKETSTSGIIVMEDVDAMTKVVHKRNYDIISPQSLTTVDLIDSNENPLTLEYFLNILQGTLTRDNSVFIATTNHLEILDPAFYRAGRFDIKIEMKPADHYQISEIYKTFFERPIDEEKLKKIPQHKYTPAQFIFKFAEFIIDPNASDDEILNEFYD